MARREVRPPAGWEEEQNNRSDNGGAPQAPVNKPAEEQLNTPSSDDNITTGNTGEK
jgi:cell division protease FtsH